MTNIRTKIEQFREKFVEESEASYISGEKYTTRYFNEHLKPEEVEQWLADILTQTQADTAEEIKAKLQPAFDDFNEAGQILIEKGYKNSGTEMIENIGFMKSVLVSYQKKTKGDTTNG